MSNETNDPFFFAVKNKFRFESNKGSLAAEDLFDLNLATLDRIAQGLDEKIQKLPRRSFIGRSTASDTTLSQQLAVVEAVINVKQNESDTAKTKAAKAAQRDFLKNLLLKKEEEKLGSLSADEIRAQLAGLGEE